MPMAQVAAGHYESSTVGEGRKSCRNVFSEPNPTDPQRPLRHSLRPGSLLRSGSVLQSVPRGMDRMDGHANGAVLIVDGQTVRTYEPVTATWGVLTGLLGEEETDRAQFAFSEVQGAILSGGKIYISDGIAISEESDADYELLLSNHLVTGGFTSIASIGQRLLFTFGSRLGWSDTLDFNSTVSTYFLTTEDSPDLNVAVAVLNGVVFVFGTQTIQPFVRTGGEGAAAFRPQNNATIHRGCLARDTIVQMDNTLFWVGENYEVYRLNGITPQSILGQNTWVSRLLRKESPADLVASKYERDGQSYYILNGKNGCYAYSVMMKEWFLWESYGQDTWEWSQIVEAYGEHYAISRLNSSFAQISTEYDSDQKTDEATYGTPIVWEVSAHMPVMGDRKKIVSIRIDGTKGRGSGPDVQEPGKISMALSKDNGITKGSYRVRSTGKQGEYKKRTIWRRNGRAREPQVVAFFRSNDPHLLTAVAVNED